jgi:hypothetical protein
MDPDLLHCIALLERTPAVLDALLRDLSERWTHRNEGDETWSPYDIVGHLIHGERTDWIPRIRTVLDFGETRSFEKFDRLAQFRESEGKSLGQLLDEFAGLRSQNLQALRSMSISEADLERRGRHPSLGAVTLAHLLATWAAHDLSHLHQLSRVMAHQSREAVGPWSDYLGVLRCSGHSD